MELDDAYANGAYIENAAAFPPRWAAEAAAFRDALGARAEVALPYGTGARQCYDLFQPEGQARGVMIFVHGGFWRAFDQSSWSHLAAGALARGWAVAMPGYDLCPQVHIRDITRQIARAVQDIAARCPGPITLTGHSAGGHLVSRMLDPALTPAEVAGRLQKVCPISPLADLRPLMKTSMNDDFRMDLAEAEAESPINMADRHDVSTTVWVGGDERPSFLDQSRWLAEHWGIEEVIVPGTHHFDVIDALSDPGSELTVSLTPRT